MVTLQCLSLLLPIYGCIAIGVSWILWVVYTRLDSRRAGLFTIGLFFVIGLVWGLGSMHTRLSRSGCCINHLDRPHGGGRTLAIWDIKQYAGRKPYPGRIAIRERKGDKFWGVGRDGAGLFSIRGLQTDKRVVFAKQYDRESIREFNAVRDPIYFKGSIDVLDGRVFASGEYRTRFQKKYSHPPCEPQPGYQRVEGTWTADMKDTSGSVIAKQP